MTLERHVVIVGGGFAGLAAARGLAKARTRVTLVDRRNHHLFQPLLYQVATAGLAPNQVAVPIRSLLRSQRNATVVLDEVRNVDLVRRRVLLASSPPLPYDYLVLATGARPEYSGNTDWQAVAPPLKDVDDALEVRRRVLLAFEAAERVLDPDLQRRHLTFVVIGGGPAGVELAGALAELARFALARDFKRIRPDSTRVILIEGGPRILPSMPPELSRLALTSLQRMGIEVRTGSCVEDIDGLGVWLRDEYIESSTVLWAGGVAATSLGSRLGLPVDRTGRLLLLKDCSLPGHPDVFCIGDAGAFVPARALNPLASIGPVATQQGRFVARQIRRSLEGAPRELFAYRDRGMMVAIGRSSGVLVFGRLRLSGFFAWIAWLVLHVHFLVNFRNRLSALAEWTFSYFTYRRGARLITAGSTFSETESHVREPQLSIRFEAGELWRIPVRPDEASPDGGAAPPAEANELVPV
jgi:NADH dehydrogenase